MTGPVIGRAFLAAVLAFLVLGAGTAVATADDAPPPIPTPSGGSSSGPTYVITPGVGGSELPAPVDQKAVEKARKADQAPRRPSPQKPAASRESRGATTGAPGRTRSETVGRQTPLVTTAGSGQPEVGLGLRGFAALVGMVVLVEITVVRRSVLRRPRAAVTAG